MEEKTTKLVKDRKIVVPGFNIFLELPRNWGITSLNHEELIATPADFYKEKDRTKTYASCALTIQKTDWFYPEENLGKSTGLSILTQYYSAPQFLKKNNLHLFKNEQTKVPGAKNAEVSYYERKMGNLEFRLNELHILRDDYYKGKSVYRLINVSCSALRKEYPPYETEFSHIFSSVSCLAESDLGVCFEIVQLEKHGGNYADVALRQFLKCIDLQKVAGSVLFQGDILPEARLFCIKLSSINIGTCPHLRRVFGKKSRALGLAKFGERFISGVSLDFTRLPLRGQFVEAGYQPL